MKVQPEQAERLHRFAHDLRNRLIGLQQVLEQLGHDGSDPERMELIRFGEKQYFKALREVEVLLDDLGVDRGSITPDLERFRVRDLVNEHIDLLKHRFTGKLQRIELDIPAEFIGKRLAETGLRAKFGLNVVTVRRSNPKEFALEQPEESASILGTPGPDTEIREGDRLIVFGKVKDIERFCEKSNP